jgi:endonuclease/exonuclease/phosphatase (EEP) superfamily protein YafD
MTSALLLGISVTWLVFVLLHRLLSGRFWLWLLADLIPPVSYLVAPPLLALFALVQPWCAATSAAAFLLGVGHSGLNPGALTRARPMPPGAIRVVSWNTEYWCQTNPPDQLYDFLRAHNADVYLLQERIHGSHWYPREVPDLPRLRTEFPEHQVAIAGELVTLSRFPIISPSTPHGPWRCVYDSTKWLRTDLQLGDVILSVYNVHIPAQYLRDDNPLTRRFYTGLRERNTRRQQHFRDLHADIAANPNAVLVAGDFNTTGAMRDLHWLSRRLTTANSASRRFFPFSWSTRGLPLWQLDWTFTSGVRVHAYRLLDPGPLSDHRPQELLISAPEGPSHA